MVSSPAALALSDPVVVSFITSHARSFHSSATRRLYHSPLPRLDALAIDARGMRLSWVLPLAPSFRLRDLRLCFPLEAQAAAFVRTQTALRTLLTTAEVADPDPIPEPDTMDLPFLSTVECPLRLAHALVRSPLLTHLQTLRSLSLYDVPEALTVDHCPQLRYLGVLPLPAGPYAPSPSRTAVHEALTRFEALVMLEFELGTWMPLPTGALQRILVTELHTFCPSLRTVSLWLSSRRFVWHHNTDTDVWRGRSTSAGSVAGSPFDGPVMLCPAVAMSEFCSKIRSGCLH
ncbi:hypothetical protein EDB84DRAFT_1495547 [Lactarius hengduanensis]|nr:hypothetical protein EDB84DRAFT_1495547 [Lactarius hengduanensis]